MIVVKTSGGINITLLKYLSQTEADVYCVYVCDDLFQVFIKQ